jgi:hypothetical protein
MTPSPLFKKYDAAQTYRVLTKEANSLNLSIQSGFSSAFPQKTFTVRPEEAQIEAARHGAWKPPGMPKRPLESRPLCLAPP